MCQIPTHIKHIDMHVIPISTYYLLSLEYSVYPHLYQTLSAFKVLPVQFSLEGTSWQRSEGKQSPKVRNKTKGDTVLSIPQQAHKSSDVQILAETA